VDDLTVILVNYRTDDHTVACLDHLAGLEGEAPSQTVVVDNSPSGRLAIDAERRGSGVVYLPQSDNVGFAAGVNSGLERATGRFDPPAQCATTRGSREQASSPASRNAPHSRDGPLRAFHECRRGERGGALSL